MKNNHNTLTRGRLTLILWLGVILLFSTQGVLSYESPESARIDPLVSEKLESQPKVYVTVGLKDTSNITYGNTRRVISERRPIYEKKAAYFKALEEVFVSTLSASEFEVTYWFSSIPALAGYITQEGFERLRSDPRLTYIDADRMITTGLDDSVPLINADPEVWDLSITGEGMTVCVVDTGIDYTHPNLGNCTEAEFSAGTCAKVPGGYDYCASANCGSTDANPMDEVGHGTHVAGIVASNDSTYRGVAPDSKLIAMKVCVNSSYCGTIAIGQGVDWCRNNAILYNISIITISIYDGSEDDSLDCNPAGVTAATNAINAAYDAGIFVDVISGNNHHTNGISWPGCTRGATSVGATTKSDKMWIDTGTGQGTNKGPNLDVLAPGKDIMSANYAWETGADFVSKTGTSMAAPHVAGVAALLQELYAGSLTPDQIEEILKTSGTHSMVDGYPRVDAWEATQYMPYLNATYIDWRTENHDYRRTGFTILKGDMFDETELKKAEFVMKEDITEEQVLRPSVADLDNNGRMDVISAVHDKSSSFNPSTIYRYEMQKHTFLGFTWYTSESRGTYTLQGGAVMSPPTLDNVDGDDEKEIVVTLRNGTVAVLEAVGDTLQLKWKRSFPQKETSTLGGGPSLEFNGGAAVADLDLDGDNEIILADVGLRNYLDWPAEVLVLNGMNGNTLWDITYNDITTNATPGAYAPLSVENIDDDPEPEIIVPSYNGVYVFDYNSSENDLKNRCNTSHGFLEGSAIVIDSNRDNQYELVYTTTSFFCASGKTCLNKTYIVDAKTCAEVDSIALDNISRVTPVVGNIDTDSNMEIVMSFGIGGSSGYPDEGFIKCYDLVSENQNCFYNDNGNLHTAFVSPNLADIDNDGDNEIIFGENNGTRVHVLRGSGTLDYTYEFGAFIDSSLAIADIDGDDMAEIALKKAGSPITLLATVSNQNEPPYFTQTIENITTIGGDLIDINASGTVSATDPDGDALTFTFGAPFNESGLWQTTANDSGTFEVMVKVSDGNLSDTQYVEVRVFNATTEVLTNFSDGTSEKSFSYAGGENHTTSVRLPKDVVILYTTLKLTGSRP